MFGQNRFRYNGGHSSGLDKPENCRDKVANKNDQNAHEQWYCKSQTIEFRPNFEFAMDRVLGK